MYRNKHAVFQTKLYYPQPNLSKTPRELQYVERSVFMKEVNTQNFGLLDWEHKKLLLFLYGLLLVFSKGIDNIRKS